MEPANWEVKKRTPFLGSKKNGIFPFFLEAVAFFKWANHALADADKPLCINMDETSLLLKPLLAADQLQPRLGLIKHLWLPSVHGAHCLPVFVQTALFNHYCLRSLYAMNDFSANAKRFQSCLAHWFGCRRAHGFACYHQAVSALAGKYIEKSSAFAQTAILVMDLAPAHMHRSIPSTARQENLRLLFIPPGLTSWLQPADVGCFGPLKTQLEILYRELKASNADGEISKLECLMLSIVLWRRFCHLWSGNAYLRNVAFWARNSYLNPF